MKAKSMGKAEDGTFSVRGLIRLIIPLMIGLTLDLIVGMIDSVMLLGSGESAVSGVSLVDSLIQLLIYIFAALAAGGAILRGNIWARKQLRRKSRGRRTCLAERAGFAGCDASWRSRCANGSPTAFRRNRGWRLFSREALFRRRGVLHSGDRIVRIRQIDLPNDERHENHNGALADHERNQRRRQFHSDLWLSPGRARRLQHSLPDGRRRLDAQGCRESRQITDFHKLTFPALDLKV